MTNLGPNCTFRTPLLATILIAAAFGQKGQSGGQPGQSGGQGSQSSGTGSQAQTGLSYSPAEWPQLRLPDVKGPAPTSSKDGRSSVLGLRPPTTPVRRLCWSA